MALHGGQGKCCMAILCKRKDCSHLNSLRRWYVNTVLYKKNRERDKVGGRKRDGEEGHVGKKKRGGEKKGNGSKGGGRGKGK